MIRKKTIIAGTGCCLVDQVYNNISFTRPAIRPYLSIRPNDGGLVPGQLVFAEEFEKFCKKSYREALLDIVGKKKADSVNIGGPSIVSLIHASQMLGMEDFQVQFYGMAGNDDEEKYLRYTVEKTPVDITHLRNHPGITPSTIVLSDPDYDHGNGERVFINSIATAWEMSKKHLTDDFFQADIVAFGGTALTPEIHDNLSELLQRAKQNKRLTVVNTVFDFRNEKRFPGERWPMGDGDQAYFFIDLLIMDHLEALKYSGEKFLEDAILFFKNSGVGAFIITNGAEEVLCYANAPYFKRQDLYKLPVSKEVGRYLKEGKKGDTTGCGDNFAGGVIACLAKQLNEGIKTLDLLEAVKWGIVSGGFACFYLGGSYLEEKSGEKSEKIKHLHHLYEQQLRNQH
jgi:sugar/nucleoside kinase (ribokinase family)